MAAIAGAGLADYQRAAGYLADTWGCVSVRAEQQGPGLIRLRGLHRDPLLAPARIDLSGIEPAVLDVLVAGLGRGHSPVMVRLAEVSGIVVAGLAGFGKTMLVAHLLGQLAPSPAVQFVLVDGKGGPDYDRLVPRAWLSAKDDLDEVRDVLRRVHRLMVDRQGAIAQVLGVTDAWHLGPSPCWPLVVVVIDEAHTFFHERKGTSPEVKAHNALVAELSRLVEELIRKGRNVAIQVMLLTQRATGDAIPTRIRDNCQVAITFATRTVDGAVAALGEEIRQHPDASPVLLNDPAYVGVAVTSLPGRPGFHRVRTPQVDHHQVAAIIRATAGLRADPAELLADQTPGLRIVPGTPGAGRRSMNWADFLVGSGGLPGPTVWVDPVPTKQLPQPLDLAVQLVVFLDDRGQVHPGGPFPLPLGQPGQELLFLVAQRCGLLEVLRLDRGLLLPPHLGQLLLSLAKIIGHGHADQPHPRTDILAAGIAAQHLDDLLTHPGQVGAQLDQHLGGHALALADQPEQDVLGADVVVAQLQRLAQRQLKDLLGSGGERDVPGGGALTLADDLLDLGPDGLQRDPERLQRLGGDPFALVDQPEQDVLGADVVVIEEPSLLLREHDDPPGPVGEPLKHLLFTSSPRRRFWTATIPRSIAGHGQGRPT